MHIINKSLTKREIVLGVLLLIFVIISIHLTVSAMSVNNEEIPRTEITLKENLTFQVNSELKLLSLTEKISNGAIINGDEILDTSLLGTKEIILRYINEEYIEKEYLCTINIVDTGAPVIEYTKELSTIEGTDIDLLANVTVSDNSKEELTATVVGEYSFNEEGTYLLKYVATDSSGNSKEEEFTLTVVPKPVVTRPAATSTSRSSTDTAYNLDTNNAEPEDNGQYNQGMAREVFNLVNSERESLGLSTLTWDSSLESAAKTRAKELVTSFSHTRPNGTNCKELMPSGVKRWGENLAMAYTSVQVVYHNWKVSSAHYENMIASHYTHAGFSLYIDENNEYYWVQLFATK